VEVAEHAVAGAHKGTRLALHQDAEGVDIAREHLIDDTPSLRVVARRLVPADRGSLVDRVVSI
jgi:hypothetical protein